MGFQAVIFDLDGTIIDTEWIWMKAKHDLLAARNVHLSELERTQLENKVRSTGLGVACSIIKQETGITEPTEVLVKEMEQRACDLYANNLQFITGFEQFHQQVLACNLKTGIATSSDRQTLNKAKAHLNLEVFFGKHIYDIVKVNYRYKPDPAIYLLAAHSLGVDPRKCIAIEDSAPGISAAQNAGMFCIGINSAGNRKAIAHADMVIDSYDELHLQKVLDQEQHTFL